MNKQTMILAFLALIAISCGGGTGGNTVPDMDRAVAPSFSPPAGTYHAAQNVTISTTTSGATIKYTRGPTDNIAPPTSSNFNGLVYSSPISIDKTTVVKTVCFKDGMTESVATAKYIITECDCTELFCHDFERGDLYGHCSNTDYWSSIDANNTYYSQRAATANAGRDGTFGIYMVGASPSNNPRHGLYHSLADLKPTEISFWVATASTNKDVGYFDLSQSVSGIKRDGIIFHLGSDGKIYVNNIAYGDYAMNGQYFVEFKNIQWNTIGVAGGAAYSTFDLYINNVLMANDANFKTTGLTAFDFLMLYNLDNAEIWYDDIIMN